MNDFQNKISDKIIPTGTVDVYTDGSCYYKTRVGGVGIYINYNDKEEFLDGGFTNTTISRMELLAVIESLKNISDKSLYVTTHSDSQYVVNSINKGYVFGWEVGNWFERNNSDLWKKFLIEYRKFKKDLVIFEHIRGHQGIEGNEIADFLADYKNQSKYIEDIKL